LNKLEFYKEVCRQYLIINDDSYIDVVFGVFFANRLDSNPVWLYLIGSPSSGKTEVAASTGGKFIDGKLVLSDSDLVIMRDTLTIHSLISGYIPKDGKKGPELSLLPLLDGKILIIKDFTLMLQMRREVLHEILGQLRAAYDGNLVRSMGTETKGFDAKFGIIACVTADIDQHRAILAALGERFLSFRLPPCSDYEGKKRSMKATDGQLTSEQRLDLAVAAHNLINSNPKIPTITTPFRRKLVNMAAVVARARTEVRRDRYTKEPDLPDPEVPVRISKQLVDLALGITMARNKHAVGQSEIDLVSRVALHAVSPKRLLLFTALLNHYPEEVSAVDIAEEIRFKEGTVALWLDDLYLLELVDRRTAYKPIGETKRLTKCHFWKIRDAKTLKQVII